MSGARLTVRDLAVLIHLTTTYCRGDGDRRIPFSLGAAAKAAGYAAAGGSTRKLMHAALARMRGVTIQCVVRYLDEHGATQEDTLGWGLIDSYRTTTRGRGAGYVVLSEVLAGLLSAGSVTFVDSTVHAALLAQDELAARLWVALEAETSHGETRRRALLATDGDERNLPALADLLRLGHWKRPRKLKERIARAAAVITATDERYAPKAQRLPPRCLGEASLPHSPPQAR